MATLDPVAELQGWLQRHQIFQTLATIAARMQELEAKRKGSKEWHDFKVDYDRKMPQIMSMLDLAPVGQTLETAHDNLVRVLWRGRKVDTEDEAFAAARIGDWVNARSRLKSGWELAKTIQREQAALSQQPSLAATIGKTLELSAIDRGEVMKWFELAVKIAKSFYHTADRVRLLNEAAHALHLPNVPTMIEAGYPDIVWELAEDMKNGSTALAALSEFGAATVEVPIGTAAAGILSVGIVGGLCLEALSVLTDLLEWLAGHEQKQTASKAMVNLTNIAKDIADPLAVIIKNAEPIIKYGRYVRTFLRK